MASALALLTAVAAASPALAGTGDWAQFRYGPDHTGYNPTETIIGTSNASDLAEEWYGTTGGPVLSSPAVSDGVVYVGTSGNLYAFPTSCGTENAACKPLWHGAMGNVYGSSPAVADGVVYVGSEDDNLYAFPASCGTGNASCTPLWHGTTGNPIFSSSPAVANGVVYVGSYDGNLYAFPASCGTGNASCTPLWHGTTGNAIASSPAVANGVVYVGSFDGNLYAFPASCGSGNATCTPLWHAVTGDVIDASPAVANGVVYVGSDDFNFYAFDASGTVDCFGTPKVCQPLWMAPTGDVIQSSAAVANGVVYVGSHDGNLYAFPASCGTSGATCIPLWYGNIGNVFSSPAVANGVVYVGSENHHLYAFPASCGSGNASCNPLWAGTTGGSVYSSPAVADGVVYVGSWDHNLYAFGLSNAKTSLASADASGTEGNGVSSGPATSADGSEVVFVSSASNLVPGDTNGVADVFVKNQFTGAISLVSISSNGTQANGASSTPAVSPDGRWVAFVSGATNLVPKDTNGVADVFLKDLSTGKVTRASITSTGAQANGASSTPSISTNGTRIAFISTATNLVASDTNGVADVFIRDRAIRTTFDASVSSTGAQGPLKSYAPAISADAQHVAFVTASALGSADSNGVADVYVNDLNLGKVNRASLGAGSAQANGPSSSPAISSDGSRVVFLSSATNLVAGDTNGVDDDFLRVRLGTGSTTTRVSVSGTGTQGNGASLGSPSISGDGTRVAFSSLASNLVAGDSNGVADVFVVTVGTSTITLESRSTSQVQGNGASTVPSLSGDGDYVVFVSGATNLVPGDINGVNDVFARGPLL